MNTFQIGMLTPEEAEHPIKTAMGMGDFVERTPSEWWDWKTPDKSRLHCRFQMEYLFDTLADSFSLELDDYEQKAEDDPPMQLCNVFFVNSLPVTLQMDGDFDGNRGIHGTESGAPVDPQGKSFQGLPGAIDGYSSFAVWQARRKGWGPGVEFVLRFMPIEQRFPYELTVGIHTPQNGRKSDIRAAVKDLSGNEIGKGALKEPRENGVWGESACVRWQGTVRGKPAALALHADIETSVFTRSYSIVAALVEE